MTTPSSSCLAKLSDLDFLKDLKRLLSSSRRLEAELLAHLAEVDARRFCTSRNRLHTTASLQPERREAIPLCSDGLNPENSI